MVENFVPGLVWSNNLWRHDASPIQSVPAFYFIALYGDILNPDGYRARGEVISRLFGNYFGPFHPIDLKP